MATISIDIDGVLACHNLPAYIASCIQHLDIEIAQEELAALSLQSFLAHKAVADYQERVGSGVAQSRLAWMYYHYDVLVQASMIKCALAGVVRCSEVADVCYCTARYLGREQWNQDMQIATVEWLAKKGFPNPEHVVFCRGYGDKMSQLARMSQECEGRYIHIDDRWKELLNVGCTMPEQFAMIAFGAQVDAVSNGCIALPRWEHIDRVIEELKERGYLNNNVKSRPN
jgi:hypothetical protein